MSIDRVKILKTFDGIAMQLQRGDMFLVSNWRKFRVVEQIEVLDGDGIPPDFRGTLLVILPGCYQLNLEVTEPVKIGRYLETGFSVEIPVS